MAQIARSNSVCSQNALRANNVKREQTSQNVRLFNNIAVIHKRPIAASVTNIKNPFLKPLNASYQKRQQELIVQENSRISKKMLNIKSDYSKSSILKTQNSLLEHRSHLMKFKPKKRNDIVLPSIMKKEMKVKLKGLQMRIGSAYSKIELNNSNVSDTHPSIARTRMYTPGALLIFIAPSEYYFDSSLNLIRTDLDYTNSNEEFQDKIWSLGKYARIKY